MCPTLGLLHVHLGEEGGAGAEVVAADLGGIESLGVPHVGVADDGEVLPVGLEGLERGGREIEVAADRGRGPQVLLDADGGAARRAVDHLDRGEADLAEPGLREGGARGDHGVEEGQGHGGPRPRRAARREM